MIYIIYIVVLIVYWFCPKYLQIIIMLANLFIPDSIPMIDEIIMVAGLLKTDNN